MDFNNTNEYLEQPTNSEEEYEIDLSKPVSSEMYMAVGKDIIAEAKYSLLKPIIPSLIIAVILSASGFILGIRDGFNTEVLINALLMLVSEFAGLYAIVSFVMPLFSIFHEKKQLVTEYNIRTGAPTGIQYIRSLGSVGIIISLGILVVVGVLMYLYFKAVFPEFLFETLMTFYGIGLVYLIMYSPIITNILDIIKGKKMIRHAKSNNCAEDTDTFKAIKKFGLIKALIIVALIACWAVAPYIHTSIAMKKVNNKFDGVAIYGEYLKECRAKAAEASRFAKKEYIPSDTVLSSLVFETPEYSKYNTTAHAKGTATINGNHFNSKYDVALDCKFNGEKWEVIDCELNKDFNIFGLEGTYIHKGSPWILIITKFTKDEFEGKWKYTEKGNYEDDIDVYEIEISDTDGSITFTADFSYLVFDDKTGNIFKGDTVYVRK